MKKPSLFALLAGCFFLLASLNLACAPFGGSWTGNLDGRGGPETTTPTVMGLQMSYTTPEPPIRATADSMKATVFANVTVPPPFVDSSPSPFAMGLAAGPGLVLLFLGILNISAYFLMVTSDSAAFAENYALRIWGVEGEAARHVAKWHLGIGVLLSIIGVVATALGLLFVLLI